MTSLGRNADPYKAALAATKARGVKLGNPNLDAIRGSGGEAGKAEAERFAGTVLPIIKQVKASRQRAVAEHFLHANPPSFASGKWS